jgi:hypothetical protein
LGPLPPLQRRFGADPCAASSEFGCCGAHGRYHK